VPSPSHPDVPVRLPRYDRPGEALPTWTYANEELLELEYQEFFLNGWQMVGHVSELQKPGDFLTFDLWRDSVIVMCGKDRVVRAFKNVCRHRASRLLDGKGNCGGAVQCQYHGWSYRNDGTLVGVPQPENFPGLDKSKFGLQEVRIEVYRGHIFVHLLGEGPEIGTLMGPLDEHISIYAPESYEPLGDPIVDVWNCNWKLAWDNYQENYHIPIGHPCLQRMLVEGEDAGEFSGGINYGYFEMRDKLSSVQHERRYQELIGCTDHRYPEGRRRKWLQIGMDPNMGIEYYPELFSLFQLLPMGVDKTLVRLSNYTPPGVSAEERELQEINVQLLHEVNDQDKVLVERIQCGVRSSGYEPGPLALAESSIHRFHERVRDLIPVTRLPNAPLQGTLHRENERLKSQSVSP
jgi:phenylpropionate dioxygenase-like ring-hydroxylating dioxygenase large terminal subunit